MPCQVEEIKAVIAQVDNAKAVGAGGVMIGGNASGSNILNGDDNVVNDEKKRKKK